MANLIFSPHPELWLVRGKLVATTASYNMPYCKPDTHEVSHYYCGICGEEWGLRVTPAINNSPHYFYRSRCFKHGGTEDMLNPYERHFTFDMFSSQVLAYLLFAESRFIQPTQEVENEDEARESNRHDRDLGTANPLV